ncbi:MAG: UDP-N-acetylglucosamine 2-epimerase (hydrolyzing) [Candidatus Eisenbacteria bacterium]|uniref:UDP-N-acetylglucosamine 2-epimerase (Hydrolyzing) n=1 Tax=Eiseniibacteriota bacterium TaxID=2212470 RepID=A0A538SG74_UNCEI|nr:MAG: UDP-N-acetylglucosamine 2-epimerase (hydrolyzing) [Candidatus Eisenbacteria bacterium]
MKRRIAVFTGNRAEYGLQHPILRAIAADARLEYYLLAGGAHLQQDFGATAAEIEADGFSVYQRVDIRMGGDNLFGTAQAIGSGVLSVSGILNELRPDFVVVYADRFESFAALIASTQMSMPTAHIEGGDYTEGGALDDSVRHAMTKLAHLHFTTNEQAAERVRNMGEEPWRVFNVGFPALDLVAAGLYANREEVLEQFGLDASRPVVLFCQHSVATEFDKAAEQVVPALEALEVIARKGYQVILTYPNNDAGGRRIIAVLEEFASAGVPNVQCVKSLGRHHFHGVLNLIGRVGRGCFVGNSSAGIKETPAFGCPAVNIGTRQQGRLRAANVIDVPYSQSSIVDAVRRCVEDEMFRHTCQTCVNPYGAGNAGPRIAEVLATVPIDRRLIQKRMTY